MQNENKNKKVLKNNVLPYCLAAILHEAPNVKYDIEGQGY